MSKLIYIAEDEQNIRDLEARFLEKSGFLVLTFGTGEELWETFQKQAADLVILDVMLPGMDGFALCSLLRHASNVPIVFVSAKDSEIDRVTGITLGSDDYMVKPFSPVELIARVQAIFRRIEMSGVQTITPPKPAFDDLTIDLDRRELACRDLPIATTPTEFDLMHYFIQNSNRAISREELLRHVWRFTSDTGDTRATDDTIKRLRKKLKAAGSQVQIETVRGFGFRIARGSHDQK